jgi:hypothetical protein
MRAVADVVVEPLAVGRERELSALARVLDEDGPRVCFVYGLAGIGKSTLLGAFAARCHAAGVAVWQVDCGSIDPTEAGFRAGLAAAGWVDGDAGVVLVDTYEVFRIADPWLRHELVPSLSAAARFVVAGRDAPMLEWSVERGRLGGLEILPLGPLDDEAVASLLAAAGVEDARARQSIMQLAGGHPLALRLAAEAGVADVPLDEAAPRVIDRLAAAFRDGLDVAGRELLDAASIPRRVTRGVLDAMLGDRAEGALERLAAMSFVDVTSEGLRLHDAVQAAVSARLRAIDPESFRKLRAAAWGHLQQEIQRAGSSDLHRSTADLLFLIDNPRVREAIFPTTAHAFSVEAARPADEPALRAMWHRDDTPEGAAALDAWLRLRPQAVRAVRDRTGEVVGCSIVAEWRDIPPSLERADPVVAAWSRHAARHPLPPGQRTLTHRRVLAVDGGEGPSGPQAAAWLDIKRYYFGLRPHLGRLYIGIRDPQPFLGAMLTLGFQPFDQPIDLGSEPFHSAHLDFGPESIDGWLARLAAAELGIPDSPFLDNDDHTVDVDGTRVPLSPLEFGVLASLAARRGSPVSRVDLLAEVWGTSYDGGSNTVDVVIRNIRKKVGPIAARLETVRGVGYRLR